MSAMRHSKRLQNSVALVEAIVDHICTNYKSISLYGLKNSHPSYEVWVEYKNKIVTVQSLTRAIIYSCTDPDEETAVKFQAFIERCIRQGMKAVMSEVN